MIKYITHLPARSNLDSVIDYKLFDVHKSCTNDLKILIDRKGRVQTRDQLLEDVWGYSSDVTTRTVDTHIKRLREKLGPMGKYVQTIRGVGYKFSRSPD